ncbi:MAG: SPOR domain-containing protein [Caldimonas sp.]
MKSISSRAALQRGGFIIGLVVGLLIGLAIALGVALYVTKAPNPFVNKVQPRPAGQDAAEAERNRNWDPNSALAGKNPASSAAAASAGATSLLPPAVMAPPTLVAPTVIDPINPNAATGTRPVRPAVTAASGVGPEGAIAVRGLPSVTTLPGADPFIYFVQAGAYARNEDAEQQRAKLAIMGIASKLTEREQGGRTVYRVRVGPFVKKEEADAAKDKLADAGVDSALVRVQK